MLCRVLVHLQSPLYKKLSKIKKSSLFSDFSCVCQKLVVPLHLKTNDNTNNMNKDIVTIDCIDIINEQSYDIKETCQVYYSIDDAIETAKALADSSKNLKSVFNISVYVGEYETPNGDIFGESEAIYTASNKSKEQTMKARKQSGYCRLEVDYYAL